MSEISLPEGFTYKCELYANSKSQVIKAAKDGKDFAIKRPLKVHQFQNYIETEVEVYKKNFTGIVKFYDHIIVDKNHYLVFKYYPCTLSRFIQSNPRINTNTLFRWAMQIAKTMSKLHEENYIHRDLSPDNILLTDCSEAADVVIADLELNINTDDRIPETRIYKRGFSAPEIGKGIYTNKVDTFSFGAIIYYCLTNQLYDRSRFGSIESDINAEKGWVELLRMSLDEDSENRKSFAEILEMLQNNYKKIRKVKRFMSLLYYMKNLNCSRIMENFLIRIALKQISQIGFFNIKGFVNFEDTQIIWKKIISSMKDISSTTIKNEKNALIGEFDNLMSQIQNHKIKSFMFQVKEILKNI